MGVGEEVQGDRSVFGHIVGMCLTSVQRKGCRGTWRARLEVRDEGRMGHSLLIIETLLSVLRLPISPTFSLIVSCRVGT